jgi:hypothetical protein
MASQINTQICFMCKKKSHILQNCRCGNSYCLKHLVPEKHTCSYNFKLYTSKDYSYVTSENRIVKI